MSWIIKLGNADDDVCTRFGIAEDDRVIGKMLQDLQCDDGIIVTIVGGLICRIANHELQRHPLAGQFNGNPAEINT